MIRNNYSPILLILIRALSNIIIHKINRFNLIIYIYLFINICHFIQKAFLQRSFNALLVKAK